MDLLANRADQRCARVKLRKQESLAARRAMIACAARIPDRMQR
jgi:hypothetical protein